jgi:hypothetical protein
MKEMSIFSIFRRRKPAPELTKEELEKQQTRIEELRAYKADLAQANHELKLLERKAEVAEIKAQISKLTGTGEAAAKSKPEDILFQLLIEKILTQPPKTPTPVSEGWGNPPPPLAPPATPAAAGQSGPAGHLSDAEIKSLLAQAPPIYLKMAKNMPAEQIKAFLKGQGNFDEDTLNRAVAYIKG